MTMTLEQLFSQPVSDAVRQIIANEVLYCFRQIVPNGNPLPPHVQPPPSPKSTFDPRAKSGRAARFSWMPKNLPPDRNSFVCKWGKNDSDNETYRNAFEGLARLDGQTHSIRGGTAVREAVGKLRTRPGIWVDGVLVAEFIGATADISDPANPTATGDFRVLSQIKVNRKTVLTADAVPPDYAALEITVGRYRDVIAEPMASFGMAVCCDQTDVETMILHALLRIKYSSCVKI